MRSERQLDATMRFEGADDLRSRHESAVREETFIFIYAYAL